MIDEKAQAFATQKGLPYPATTTTDRLAWAAEYLRHEGEFEYADAVETAKAELATRSREGTRD